MQRSKDISTKADRRAEVLRWHDSTIPKPQVPAVPAVPPVPAVPAVPTVDPLDELVAVMDRMQFAEDRRKEQLYFEYQRRIHDAKEKFQKLDECLKDKNVSRFLFRQRVRKILDTWGYAIIFDKQFRDKLSAEDLELIKEEIKEFAEFRITVGLKTADFFRIHEDCYGDTGTLDTVNAFISKEVDLIDSVTDNLFA